VTDTAAYPLHKREGAGKSVRPKQAQTGPNRSGASNAAHLATLAAPWGWQLKSLTSVRHNVHVPDWPNITDAISISEARANLQKGIDRVIDDHAPVAITRRGAGAAVVVSMDDWNGLLETVHLLSNPKDAARLLRAVNCDGKGRVALDGETFAKPADDDPEALLSLIRDARRV
jgi:antitoxin YefM